MNGNAVRTDELAGGASPGVQSCGSMKGESVFSSREFVHAWCRSASNGQQPLSLAVVGSGNARSMWMVQMRAGRWGRSIPITRVDFCSSPAWEDTLEPETVRRLLQQLTTLRTREFTWFVRFDHGPLADRLVSLGIGADRSATRILSLADGYEKVFSGYSATLRNHVRKAARRGVTVRETSDPKDVADYYELYMQLVVKKGWTYVYPIELSYELIKWSAVTRFFVAEFEGRPVGGAMFLRDGEAVYLMHSALDHDHASLYPVCALYDHAVREACERGAAFVNFGGSGNNAQLDEFKASWGAQTQLNWRFVWANPFWRRVSDWKAGMRRRIDAYTAR